VWAVFGGAAYCRRQKGLFYCMLFCWELQADNLVRWDVAERLNRKQTKQTT
jgi:hypothetical protein